MGGQGQAQGQGFGGGAPGGGGKGGRQGGDPSESLFVAGLPLTTNEEYLNQVFAPYGTIVSCRILPENGRADKAALVHMASVDMAFQALTLHGTQIPQTNHTLVVRFADRPGGKGKGWGKGDGDRSGPY